MRILVVVAHKSANPVFRFRPDAAPRPKVGDEFSVVYRLLSEPSFGHRDILSGQEIFDLLKKVYCCHDRDN